MFWRKKQPEVLYDFENIEMLRRALFLACSFIKEHSKAEYTAGAFYDYFIRKAEEEQKNKT